MTPFPSARSVYLHHGRNSDAQSSIEERFLSGLRLANGTYKATGRHRLTDADALLDKYLPADDGQGLLDIAISSGVTSLDLWEVLSRRRRALHMVATDLYTSAELFALGPVDVLADQEGVPLQVAAGSACVVRPHAPRGSVRRAVLSGAFRCVGALLRALKLAGLRAEAEIPLVLREVATHPSIALEQDDVLERRAAWEGQFAAVRVANIANLDYFNHEALVGLLGNVAGYIADGGLLLVCRSLPDGSNHGTLFRKGSSGLTVLARLGAGSEVESIALGLPPFSAQSSPLPVAR